MAWAFGNIDVHKKRDLWDAEPPGSLGSASTTSPSVVDYSKKNPIGFIWPVDDTAKL
jgi:hypothetical protein